MPVVSPGDIALGVNVDHVATLRQARGTLYPSPLEAALLAERHGADSITIHLREDRRHIQDGDVTLINAALSTRLNLEMAVTDEMIDIALATRPADCCLVPERREELTTEGGLDVAGQYKRIAQACARLDAGGIRVSLFVDPEPEQLQACRAAGAPVVELHTGGFADAATPQAAEQELNRVLIAARFGAGIGLRVHAGHGLNYDNVAAVAGIGEIVELNIGHAIVARAVFDGLGPAVADMKQLMRNARPA